jgi:glycosyltransferase involved in cell wall biosynthesis
MRLLFIIHSLGSGGAERVTATLANYWAAKDWHVTVVTIDSRERDFYALDRRVERIELSLARRSPNAVAAVFNNLRRMARLRHVLKQTKPDVAVSMMSTANALLAISGRGLDTLTVGSERIHPPALPLGTTWEAIRRWTYHRLDALVMQTEQSADWVRAHTGASESAVIPNPVTYPLAIHEPIKSPESITDKTGTSRLLLGVGRLVEQKGFDRLIKAFAATSAGHPEWLLVIVGEGERRSSLEDLAAELGVQDRVRLPGVVGNLREWYERADLFALTSRFEGFPNALVEALAHGVPVVAVDCETGPREIVRHERDGLLVAQNDPSALVRALNRLMEADSLREQFAQAAVDARERFSLDRIAGMWEGLFHCV